MSNNLEAANTPLHGSQLKTRCHLPMVAWIFAPHYPRARHLASTVVTWGKLQHCGWPQSGDRHYGNDWRQRSGGYSSGTAHWQDSSGTKQDNSGAYTLSGNKTLADGFHVYSLVWDQQSIAWYIDDVQYHSMALDNSSNLQAFHKPFFLISVAVGGNWPGSPTQTPSPSTHARGLCASL